MQSGARWCKPTNRQDGSTSLCQCSSGWQRSQWLCSPSPSWVLCLRRATISSIWLKWLSHYSPFHLLFGGSTASFLTSTSSVVKVWSKKSKIWGFLCWFSSQALCLRSAWPRYRWQKFSQQSIYVNFGQSNSSSWPASCVRSCHLYSSYTSTLRITENNWKMLRHSNHNLNLHIHLKVSRLASSSCPNLRATLKATAIGNLLGPYSADTIIVIALSRTATNSHLQTSLFCPKMTHIFKSQDSKKWATLLSPSQCFIITMSNIGHRPSFST